MSAGQNAERAAGIAVARRRLAAQLLSHAHAPALSPVAVVGHFGAMQAQEFAVAKWSIGQRSAAATDAEVQRLLDEGAILRTHALRPTWHFVAAADIGWIQALAGPRVKAMTAYFARQQGVDADLVARANKAIGAALAGGNHLTRAEISTALAASGIDAVGSRLGLLLMHAELDGLIASGVMRGKQQTYALISERAPDRVEMGRDDALRELAIRFFRSHGPATIKDFNWWASLPAGDIKRGIALAGEALASEDIGGVPHWFTPETPAARERAPSAHILQGYDEFVVAYTPRSRAVVNVAGLDLTPSGVLPHPIVLDGQMVGYWRRRLDGDGLAAEPRVARPLTPAQRRAIDREFAAYERFAGARVSIRWPEAAADSP